MYDAVRRTTRKDVESDVLAVPFAMRVDGSGLTFIDFEDEYVSLKRLRDNPEFDSILPPMSEEDVKRQRTDPDLRFSDDEGVGVSMQRLAIPKRTLDRYRNRRRDPTPRPPQMNVVKAWARQVKEDGSIEADGNTITLDAIGREGMGLRREAMSQSFETYRLAHHKHVPLGPKIFWVALESVARFEIQLRRVLWIEFV